MKYIKKFKHEEEFNAFKDSDKYVTPNVSYIHGVEKSKLRRNVKFKIKDKECNAGADMTWEEWSKQKNPKHFGNEGFATTDGKVFSTDSLYVYKNLPTYELKENTIIPQHIYDLYDDPDKVIFYTSTDGNIVTPRHSSPLGDAKLLSNEYKDGLGRMVFNKKITIFKEGVDGFLVVGLFSGRKTLDSIWIPGSVTVIDDSCFYNCTELKHVHSWGGVTNIAYNSFNNCSKLQEINLPDTVIELGDQCFGGCTSVTHVRLGKNVKNISKHCFSGCSSLETIHMGESIETIGNYAFQQCPLLKKVEMPNTVLTLGEQMFRHDTSLEEIIISNSVVNLPIKAFYEIPGLKRIVIPDSVQRIEEDCFYRCNNLESVIIGDGVTYIGTTAFGHCERLSNLSLGSNIIEIASGAFTYCKMQHLVLPNSLKIIGGSAFSSNSSLETVTFGNGMETMGANVFKYCGKLQYLYGPNTTQDNKALIINGVLSLVIKNGLTTYTIPSNVKEISASCFYGFSNLKSITISEGVEKIGANAFDGCDGLSTITIPSTVTEIGSSAFSISFTDNKTGFYGKFASDDNKCLIVDGVLKAVASKGLTSFNIPEGVTEIDNYVFYHLEHLKTITIPEGVKKIGTWAFTYCDFTEITLPSTIEEFEDGAFLSTKLTSITLPNSVKKIGTSVFNGCSYLTEVTLGKNIEWIYSNAFASCKSLTRLNITSLEKFLQINYEAGNTSPSSTILDKVKEVYLNGEKLTDVVIPETITEIKPYTFYSTKCFDNITINCNLKDEDNSTSYGPFYNATFNRITIGQNVTYIGKYAFNKCNLEELICTSMTPPTIVSDTFYGMVSGKVLYYPLGADYSSWMQKLGGYGWTTQHLYTPTEYYDLAITANDVSGRATKTSIHWTCMSNGEDPIYGTPIAGVQLSGTAVSNEFPQNLSETDTVEREITFEYQGLTAITTITQGVWVHQNYEVVLNDNWEKSTTIANPDEGLYDGVYQSFSNKGVDSTAATMYIDIVGCENFKFYIRSYGESSYDYVMVSQLDMDINNNTSYSDTSLVKAHTRSKQQSGTAISNYTLVEFTGLDAGAHRITVVYRKDGSSASGDDRGYVLIPFEQ